MTRRRGLWILLIMCLTLFVAACGSKNLVSVAKIDKGDISVRDRFGNQVTVQNPDDFRKALKGAKKVSDPASNGGSSTETDYVIVGSQGGVIAYDYDDKYLVYTDAGGARQVYQTDLTSLIGGLAGLPPRIATGQNLDSTISPAFSSISKTASPWAASFQSGQKQLVMVAAGETPSAGYTLELEKATLSPDGTLALTVRLTPPSGDAATVISYPYMEIMVNSSSDLDVRLVTAGDGGDKMEHVPLTAITGDQVIIPVRPERGALVLEQLRVAAFVKSGSAASVEIEIEDGHNVLGRKTVNSMSVAGDWAYFESSMGISVPTNAYGSVIFRWDNSEVIVPVSFSGK